MALTQELTARGHAVRATTRNPARLTDLEDAGAEAVLGDPDRIATLAPALDHVSAAYILLGSAQGDPASVQALHSTRLDMLLTKMLDSTVRGIVYEAAGSVPATVRQGGAERVRAFCEDSRVPYVLLSADPGDRVTWLQQAAGALDLVLAAAV
jgi:putative NADH-flavin reductase